MRCGRAWDSDGLYVQQALIKTGWPAPTLSMISDEANVVGPDSEKDMLAGFTRAVSRGTYHGYGVPLSKSTVLKNFLPMPGSPTRADTNMLLQVGGTSSFGFATLREAYHVPLVVPAAVVPDEFAPTGARSRASWLAAKARGEPFVLESHASRGPSNRTNFEIRPLTTVIAETYTTPFVYSSGNLLLAPNSAFVAR
jgi:hypothetical protein